MSGAAEIQDLLRDLLREQNRRLGELCDLLRQGRQVAGHPLESYLDRETRIEAGRLLAGATPEQRRAHNQQVLAEARNRHGKK